VRLLFRNAYFLKCVQNGFAFYLKLSGQIIDSNLHPLCISSRYFPLRDHIDLTALNCFPNKLLFDLFTGLCFRWSCFLACCLRHGCFAMDVHLCLVRLGSSLYPFDEFSFVGLPGVHIFLGL